MKLVTGSTIILPDIWSHKHCLWIYAWQLYFDGWGWASSLIFSKFEYCWVITCCFRHIVVLNINDWSYPCNLPLLWLYHIQEYFAVGNQDQLLLHDINWSTLRHCMPWIRHAEFVNHTRWLVNTENRSGQCGIKKKTDILKIIYSVIGSSHRDNSHSV